MAEFIEEILLLRRNVESIAARMDSPRPVAQRADALAARLDTILDAARRASGIGGGMQVW
ncbi:hypothetical protein [Kitasatospora brasiliensis]|uniref:hypothetical protein n=1 Tax=Kitasatospora brasiliensis TaxID=3058040 RepID=UPI00292F2EA6|nr:hypothetical protein [Kitasatospora sp. K002]